MNVRGGAWCANEIDSQIRAARNAMHLIKNRAALANLDAGKGEMRNVCTIHVTTLNDCEG